MRDAMNIYKNALEVQDASNLSGVVFQFARDMVQILSEVRAAGGGTDEVNQHPVARMYAEQIAFLTGAGSCSDVVNYQRAYAVCEEKAKEVSKA
jgi:hypothetical protein